MRLLVLCHVHVHVNVHVNVSVHVLVLFLVLVILVVRFDLRTEDVRTSAAVNASPHTCPSVIRRRTRTSPQYESDLPPVTATVRVRAALIRVR